MKKKGKLALAVKNITYKFALSYFTLFLGINLAGRFESLIYRDEIAQYKEVVDDFADFLESIDVDEPLEIFDYFNYALWGGYLSNDHDLRYDGNRDLLYYNPGLLCVLGKSVCLNDADMLKELYKSLGYDAGVNLCYVPADGIDIDTSIRTNKDIVRKINEHAFSFDKLILFRVLSPLTGNHAITVVFDNGVYYYFDPTNLAYLAKVDFNDLKIINGTGRFKTRYLSSILFYPSTGLRNIFGSAQKDYDLEYLITTDDVVIDVDKLEEFYQKEKELIESIADSYNSKNPVLVLIVSIIYAGYLSEILRCIIENIILRKYINNEEKLETLIRDFMKKNDVKKFEDVCSYLHYLIDQGYLSSEDDSLVLRKSLFFKSPSLVTLDQHYCDKEFFESFVKETFKKTRMVTAISNNGNIGRFYIHKDGNRYLFYSYEQDKIYQLNDNCELVCGDTKYKLLSLFKIKFRKSEKNHEDIYTSIDNNLCEEFFEDKKETIEEIAKSYSYKRQS